MVSSHLDRFRSAYAAASTESPFSPTFQQPNVLHSIFSPTHKQQQQQQQQQQHGRIFRPRDASQPPMKPPPPPPPPPPVQRPALTLQPAQQQPPNTTTATATTNNNHYYYQTPFKATVRHYENENNENESPLSRISHLSEILLLSPTNTNNVSSLDGSMDLLSLVASSSPTTTNNNHSPTVQNNNTNVVTLHDIQCAQSLSELIRMTTVLKRHGHCASLLRAVHERLDVLRGFCDSQDESLVVLTQLSLCGNASDRSEAGSLDTILEDSKKMTAPPLLPPPPPPPLPTVHNNNNTTGSSSLVMSLSTDDDEGELEDSRYLNVNQLQQSLHHTQELHSRHHLHSPSLTTGLYRVAKRQQHASSTTTIALYQRQQEHQQEVTQLKQSIETLEQQNELLRDELFQQETIGQDLELAQAKCQKLESEQQELQQQLTQAQADLKVVSADRQAAVQCLQGVVHGQEHSSTQRHVSLRKLIRNATAQVEKSRAEIENLTQSLQQKSQQYRDAVQAKTKAEGLLVVVTKRVRVLEAENTRLLKQLETLNIKVQQLQTTHETELSAIKHQHAQIVKHMRTQLLQSENVIPMSMVRPRSNTSAAAKRVPANSNEKTNQVQADFFQASRKHWDRSSGTTSDKTSSMKIKRTTPTPATPRRETMMGRLLSRPNLTGSRAAPRAQEKQQVSMPTGTTAFRAHRLSLRNGTSTAEHRVLTDATHATRTKPAAMSSKSSVFRKRVTFADHLPASNTNHHKDKENHGVASTNSRAKATPIGRKVFSIATKDNTKSPTPAKQGESFTTPRPLSTKSKTPSRVEFSFSPKTPTQRSLIRISKVRAAGGRLALQEKLRQKRSPGTKHHFKTRLGQLSMRSLSTRQKN